MTLTVVLLCHNQASYLPATIDLLSDCVQHINQLILIDDASEDDSALIIAQAAERLEYVEAIVHQENLGVLAVMQSALTKCTGEHVHFLACDDRVDRAFYSECLALLARYPHAGLCSTATRLISEDGCDLGEFHASRPLQDAGYLPPQKVRTALYRLDSWFMGHATIFNRRHLIEAGGFQQELGGFSDAYACMLLALKHGACYSPEPLAKKRVHDSPYGTSMYSPENAPHILAALVRNMTAAPDTPFDKGLIQRIKGRWRFNAAMLQRDTAPSLLARMAGFIRYKPFDLISVLHRHWHARNAQIKSRQ